MDLVFKKVLIFGIDSFTGKNISAYLKSFGYDVYGTSLFSKSDKIFKCDIVNKNDILNIFKKIRPNYIIHLSAISFVAHKNHEEFYKINTIGTLNILDSIVELNLNIEKIILPSSATVYGSQGLEILDESLCPKPANHYGASKYAMECLSKNYFDKLDIIITRPFNYTGIGQADNFLIPKVVKHFKESKKEIELGNINVSREFNDIYFLCESYKRLLESNCKSEVVNIASNRGVKLLDVIELMNDISGYEINIRINKLLVRKNEIKSLTGSSDKLFSIIGKVKQKFFKDTLTEMFET
ncbi:MAG: GDP-mannose 4,6-dehydratase [Campylobacterota bacterium]|nr:GDP-mannose 4,6-dehydratase [Campylobacterota bacterium]